MALVLAVPTVLPTCRASHGLNCPSFHACGLTHARNLYAAQLFPGLPFLISNIVFYNPQFDGWGKTLAYLESSGDMLAKNAEMWSDAIAK